MAGKSLESLLLSRRVCCVTEQACFAVLMLASNSAFASVTSQNSSARCSLSVSNCLPTKVATASKDGALVGVQVGSCVGEAVGPKQFSRILLRVASLPGMHSGRIEAVRFSISARSPATVARRALSSEKMLTSFELYATLFLRADVHPIVACAVAM